MNANRRMVFYWLALIFSIKYLVGAPSTSDLDIYNNIELYNANSKPLTFDITLKSSSDEIIQRYKGEIQPGRLVGFPTFEYQEGISITFLFYFKENDRFPTKRTKLVFNNFNHKKNFFLDIIPKNEGIIILPYSKFKLIGAKKSRSGKKPLINNVSSSEIRQAIREANNT